MTDQEKQEQAFLCIPGHEFIAWTHSLAQRWIKVKGLRPNHPVCICGRQHQGRPYRPARS